MAEPFAIGPQEVVAVLSGSTDEVDDVSGVEQKGRGAFVLEQAFGHVPRWTVASMATGAAVA